MSTLLTAVGPMTWEFGNITNQAEIILEQLRAYPFKRSLNPDGVTEEEGDWTYEIHYCEEKPGTPYAPWVELYITGPYCIFPTIRNNNIELGYFYKYWFISDLSMPEWYERFRAEQFEVCRILGITEVCYLADQSLSLAYIYDDACKNWPYQKIKESLLAIGPPTPREKAISFDDYKKEDAAGQWFMDDYADIKEKGVDWFFSPYIHKFPETDDGLDSKPI